MPSSPRSRGLLGTVLVERLAFSGVPWARIKPQSPVLFLDGPEMDFGDLSVSLDETMEQKSTDSKKRASH